MKILKAWLEGLDGRCFTAEACRTERCLSVSIRPGESIKAGRMCIEFDVDIRDKKILAHGFQSWSESFIADRNTIIKPLNPIAAKLLKMEKYGDYHFYRPKAKRGLIHSNEYLRIFSGSPADENEVFFAGNLRPALAYGIFEADFNSNRVLYFTDLEGLELEAGAEFTGIEMFTGHSAAEYFEYRDLACNGHARLTGWTSWYNYYSKISEKLLLDNLENLCGSGISIDIFQIDDGYQRAVGDWLDINSKFPNGMKSLADRIREKNISPGLWLAPFSCEKTSDVFKNHREMLIKDDKGTPVKVGINPGWSWFFYGLDIYNTATREYLGEVLRTVTDDWGYKFLKLDFLYSAAVRPCHGRTRAMIMHEALSFINEIRGTAAMLGCGCPIGVGAGMMEYMRIGADVAPYWENGLLKRLNYRERVSTACSLNSTKNRYFLNGRAFLNDPDVFILRDTAELKMTAMQKQQLFDCNMQYSGMVFFSDDVSSYDRATIETVRKGFAGYKRSGPDGPVPLPDVDRGAVF